MHSTFVIERSIPPHPERVFAAFAGAPRSAAGLPKVRTTKSKSWSVFHALGDLTRRAIVEKLSEGPLSVSRLATPLDISLTAVVQHLHAL